MLKRILGIVGWVGTALVFGAPCDRRDGSSSPEWDQYAVYAAWAGLALRRPLHARPVARDRRVLPAAATRATARSPASACSSCSASSSPSTTCRTRQNKRWDLTANQQFSLSDQTVEAAAGPRRAGEVPGVRPATRTSTASGRASTEYEYQSNQVNVEYIDADQQPGAGARSTRSRPTARSSSSTWAARERVTTDAEQDLTNALIKVDHRRAEEGLLRPGPRREGPGATCERAGYSTIADALKRDNYEVDKLVLAQQKEVPADATVLVIAGPRTRPARSRRPTCSARYLDEGRASCWCCSIRPTTSRRRRRCRSRRPAQGVAVDAGQRTSSSTSAASARSSAATRPCRSRPPTRTHAITDRFNLLTAFPLARSVAPTTSATEGRVAADDHRRRARAAGPRRTCKRERRGRAESRNGRQAGPRLDRRRGDGAGRDRDAGRHAGGEHARQRAAAASPRSRVAVIGDSDFAANYALGIQGNRDLFMNTVNWLAQQENLIAIRPREAADRRLTLTAQRSHGHLLAVASFVDPGGRVRHRRLHLVAEARIEMRGLTSTLALIARPRRPRRLHLLRRREAAGAPRHKAKAFDGRRPRTSRRCRSGSPSGETARAAAASTTSWQLVEPVKADADAIGGGRRSRAASRRSTCSACRREPRRSEAVRARPGADRGRLPRQGPEGLPAPADRREDADRRRPLRADARTRSASS